MWAAHARLAQADHQGRLGHTQRALELVADAERLALSTGRASTLSGVEFVRGTIELGRGRPAEAYEHLRRSFDPADRAYHPVERLWLLDHLSEAAARTDAARQVRPVVDEIGTTIADVPSPGYHQALRLARVHLADDDEIDDRVAGGVRRAGSDHALVRRAGRPRPRAVAAPAPTDRRRPARAAPGAGRRSTTWVPRAGRTGRGPSSPRPAPR